MKKFRFSLSRVIQYSPRLRISEKVVVIPANDMLQAIEQVNKKYPEWNISMVWPLWGKWINFPRELKPGYL